MRLVKFVGTSNNTIPPHDIYINPASVRLLEGIPGGTAIYFIDRGENAIVVTAGVDIVVNELNGGLAR